MGYLSRYPFEESIKDRETLPLQFGTRAVDLRIDRKALDDEFETVTDDLSDEERDEVSKRAGRFALLVKSPARVAAVVEDIKRHFVERVAPNGFGVMIVTVDPEACVLYKDALDELADDDLPVEASDVVINIRTLPCTRRGGRSTRLVLRRACNTYPALAKEDDVRLNSKGQLTIPAELRKRYRLEPGDEVEVVEVDGVLQIRRRKGARTRGERAVDRLRGRATTPMTTDELMRLLRQ